MVEKHQEPLFETDDPTRVGPEMADRISDAAERYITTDEPDSTDRMLKDQGGGPRKKTKAANPPYVPRSPSKSSHNHNPWVRGDGELSLGEEHQTTVEEALRRPTEPSVESQKAIDRAHGAARETRLGKGVLPIVVFNSQLRNREPKS